MMPRHRSRALCLLFALSALLFVVTSAHPLHVHGADKPGLYNGECPLAEVAAPRGPAAAAPAPVALWIGLLVGTAPTAADPHVSAAPALASASRAPPLA